MSATLTPTVSKETEQVPCIEAKALDLEQRVETLLATHRRRSSGNDDSGVVRVKGNIMERVWIELVGFV